LALALHQHGTEDLGRRPFSDLDAGLLKARSYMRCCPAEPGTLFAKRQRRTSSEETRTAFGSALTHSETEYMKQIQLLLLIALTATTLGVSQNQAPAAAPQQSATAIASPDAQTQWIRILTPTAGQTLTANFVDLRFELVRPALNGEPNFIVQLDSTDPINMTSTDYTFPELQPGTHTIQVTLVDANNSPVQGGMATVRFKIATAPPAKSDSSHGTKQHFAHITGAPPSAPIPSELRNDGDPILPLAGSPLPLLSLIGFGLLIGGAAQAMRTR